MSGSTTAFVLRLARMSDARAIARVHLRAWQVGFAGIIPADYLAGMHTDDLVLRWEARLADASLRHEVWIAERGGHLVGWTTFGTSRDRDTDASVAEIHGLYVDPEWWGAGVGSRLIELAHSRLSVPPVERVTLWVLTQNHRAIEFYMKRGFRADGAKGVYERDDLRLPQMRMSRPAADTGASI